MKIKDRFINDFNNEVPNNLKAIKGKLVFKENIYKPDKKLYRVKYYAYTTVMAFSMIIMISCIMILGFNNNIDFPFNNDPIDDPIVIDPNDNSNNNDPIINDPIINDPIITDPIIIDDGKPLFEGTVTGKFSYLAFNPVSSNTIDYEEKISLFTYDVASMILTSSNSVFSPLSMFFALSLLAETTMGNTQKEILDALQVENTTELALLNQQLINYLTKQTDSYYLSINNSIWLKDEFRYEEMILDNLISNYYVSAYGVNFNSLDTQDIMKNWINEASFNQLGHITDIEYNQDTLMILINSLHYNSSWKNLYYESNGNFSTFNKTVITKYLSTINHFQYYENIKYQSVAIPLAEDNHIILIMPHNNISLNELIVDGSAFYNIVNTTMNAKSYKMRLMFPKFNIRSQFLLNDVVEELGIKDVFDPNAANFSRFISHKSRVNAIVQESIIDISEFGVEETSSTSLLTPDVVNISFNRPFIYVIRSSSGIPLYVGVMSNPN